MTGRDAVGGARLGCRDRSVRVLVVDDPTDLRRLVTAIIAAHDHGWTVAGQAADGQEALQAAQRLHPDLVLLDLSMAVMDGLQALPWRRESVPDATVVVLTGFPGDAARDAGAHGYLERDAMVGTLIPRLQAILGDLLEHAPRIRMDIDGREVAAGEPRR